MARKYAWIYTVADGIVNLTGFVHPSDAEMRYSALKMNPAYGLRKVGISHRPLTERDAIRGVRQSYPHADWPLTVKYAGDDESDAADAQAEARAYFGH